MRGVERQRLTELDRRWKATIDRQLRAPSSKESGEVPAAGLASVLFDVLVEGLRAKSDAARALDEIWTRLEGDDRAIVRQVFDYEAFMAGAFATHLGVGLAVNPSDSGRVQQAFYKEASAFWNRLRRRTPSRARIEHYVRYYLAAVDAAGRNSYLAVADAFADACVEQALDREAAVAMRSQLEAAGLEVFYRALSGTIEACQGWSIT